MEPDNMPPPVGTCENRDLHEFFSADRVYKAVRFVRWCGGEYPSYNISVLPSAAVLPNRSGNVFIEQPRTDGKAYESLIELTWNDSRHLRIARNADMKLSFYSPAVEEVAVEHVTVAVEAQSEGR